jgi:hypothetical protein
LCRSHQKAVKNKNWLEKQKYQITHSYSSENKYENWCLSLVMKQSIENDSQQRLKTFLL